MIKVIEEGIAPRGQVTCTNCGSVLEYGNSDLHKDYGSQNSLCAVADYHYILVCPVCGCEIKNVPWVGTNNAMGHI